MSSSPLMSRRDALKTGALAAAGIALAPLVPGTALARLASAARPRLELITKPIPSTGERIPVIGLGTNQYSVETAEEMAQLQAVL
ncbi:MAG: twin-arginine translocation signal domain-containing protein, partial [Gemmatimonadales bacterium]